MARPPQIEIFPDPGALAAAAATAIALRLREVVERQGRASLVASGGATPQQTYRRLASEDVAWASVDVYWGDERCVPPQDPASNYAEVRRLLLDPAGVPEDSVHRVDGELAPHEAAAAYERLLRQRFRGARPSFDLVLLGLGADGHTASLFPGVAAIPPAVWVAATRSPMPPTDRVSLTYEAIRGARRVLFLVCGSDKAAMVERVLRDSETVVLPAARVTRQAENVCWMLDREAASCLPGRDSRQLGAISW